MSVNIFGEQTHTFKYNLVHFDYNDEQFYCSNKQ